MFIIACHFKDNKLKNYYFTNKSLHQELTDSLIQFCKRYKTEITLKKTNFPDQHIRANVKFDDNATRVPIFFDTTYHRHDPASNTNQLVIPTELIKKFDTSIYLAIQSDSIRTFFAYKWDEPKNLIGTSGDSQFGILISKNPIVLEPDSKQIDKNVYITSYTAF